MNRGIFFFIVALSLFANVLRAQGLQPDSSWTPPPPGSAYVELYLPQDEWHGYCLPVDSSLTFPFTSLYINMEWYSEPEHRWWQVTNTAGDSVLAAQMRGYMLYSNSLLSPNSTVGVTGRLYTGNNSVTVTSTPSPKGDEGMNFIGNPYPSAVNWYQVALEDVDPTMYVYSSAWHNYIYFNRHLSMHSTICRSIIPQMQGFFVHCSSPAPGTGQVTMTNVCRLHDPGQIYLDNPDYDDLMEISVAGNGYRDEAQVLFIDTATLAFDSRLDALKIPGEPSAPQLYSMIEGGSNVALNTRPWNGPWNTVNLGFSCGVSGVDTLEFSNLESFSDTLEIWLQDKKENHFQLLREDPEYIFTTAPGDDTARFVIWFYNPFVSTGKIQAGAFRIWSFENRVYVDLTRVIGGRVNESLTLYDLAGRVVFTSGLSAGQLSVLAPGLVQGYYVARLEGGGGVRIAKLFISSGH